MSLYEEAARLRGGVMILDPRCLPLDPLAIGGPQWTQPGGEVAGVRLRKHLHAQDETSQSVRMLDEPSLGLAPLVVKEIFEIAAEINRVGTTVLLVEQNTGPPRDASGF